MFWLQLIWCSELFGHDINVSVGSVSNCAQAKKVTGHHIFDKSHGQKLKTSEGQSQKVSGIVHRVSMAGYGVIKSPEWGEILWRQFELPTNLRCLQFTDRAKFIGQVEHREEYRRLKDSWYLRDLESCSSQVESDLLLFHDSQPEYGTCFAIVADRHICCLFAQGLNMTLTCIM